VLEGLLQLNYMPTTDQLADILTKILPGPQFQTLLSKLGMVNTLAHSSLRGGDETASITVSIAAHLAHYITASVIQDNQESQQEFSSSLPGKKTVKLVRLLS